jgi:site-specific DNA-methyltransferase (adenine-specific)
VSDLKQEVWLGDCLELMKNIPNKSVDMILCDLPYGVTASEKWDTVIPFDQLWLNYERVIKNNGVVVLTATEPFRTKIISSNFSLFKYDLIWEKNKTVGFLSAKKQPLRKHESVLVFYKKQPTYNPQKTTGHKPVNSFTHHEGAATLIYGKTQAGIKGGGQTDRYPTSILKFSVVNNGKQKFHSTQKPVELLEYLIKTYTNEGDLVLDNCAGSGSTLVAAKNLNRQFIGIEKEKEYYDTCLKRLNNGK